MECVEVLERRAARLIADLPDRERPRERFLSRGARALSDRELLAILLRTGRRGRSVLALSGDLLARFEGDLGKLAGASVSELQTVPGIGPAKAVELHTAFELAQRLVEATAPHRPRMEGGCDVLRHYRGRFRGVTQERFYALLLNSRNELLREELITVGLVDRSHVHAREVFRAAIRESCSRMLLLHNHPSGDPTPSRQDITCTRELVAAGKIIGIHILDHVVIGHATGHREKSYTSFREENLL